MDSAPKPLVAYYRVSTLKQGASGLGLEGQVAAVDQFARDRGAEILRAYQEVESGKRADRPELARALAHARRSGATLVIAKLDRLARNVHFLAGLMEAKVDFVACDNPHANPLTIHILAAVAEDEARRISDRTRAALAAYKARGGKLGAARPDAPRLTAEARARGARNGGQSAHARADAAYADLAAMLADLRAGGLSLRTIAARLNAEGQTTRRGRPWNPVQVSRVLDRAETSRSAAIGTR
jgi:DNA invertase Pin-like site-specific DNA recombinase